MTNKSKAPQTDIMVETKGKLELFFEKYGNKVLWALIVLGTVLCAYFIFTGRNEKKAAVEHKNALIELANANILDTIEAYEDVVANCGDAKVANIAHFYAAAKALEGGDMVNAKMHIEAFNTSLTGDFGVMINVLAYGLRGDIAVDEQNYDAAVENFKAAVAASCDQHTFEVYNQKLARVYEAQGNIEAAMECYKAIVAKYPALEASYARYIW